jgi:hypothetical protein
MKPVVEILLEVPKEIITFVDQLAHAYPGITFRVGHEENGFADWVIDMDDILLYFSEDISRRNMALGDVIRHQDPPVWHTLTHPGSLVRIEGPVLYEAKVPLNK